MAPAAPRTCSEHSAIAKAVEDHGHTLYLRYLLDNTIEDIWQVKEFGDENSIEKLSNPTWNASEEDASEMTAISAYLLKSQGAYSFRSDDIRVFVVLKDMSDIGK